MNSGSDIYKDFRGYNGNNIIESEKIIRDRLLNNLQKFKEQIIQCEVKAKDHKSIKILERIITIKNRITRIEKEFEKRSDVIGHVYSETRVSRVNEEELEKIDTRVDELISMCCEILASMSCFETDMNFLHNISMVKAALKKIEEKCHVRMNIFLKQNMHH